VDGVNHESYSRLSIEAGRLVIGYGNNLRRGDGVGPATNNFWRIRSVP